VSGAHAGFFKKMNNEFADVDGNRCGNVSVK
jgi:hypothetical protein